MANSQARQDIWSLMYEDRAFLEPSGASFEKGRRCEAAIDYDGRSEPMSCQSLTEGTLNAYRIAADSSDAISKAQLQSCH